METKFENWAVVELFGHSKIAGLCSEQSIAGTTMLRVDVPETKMNPSFTRFLGGASIYAINPVTEDVVKFIAEQLNMKPIESWDINKFQQKALSQRGKGEDTLFDEEN
jgi:hypothetical protein